MITRIEAVRYRCLRDVRQDLKPFHVLIGPNASGKTTFLDVVAFLGDLITEDLTEAVANRTQNFRDLFWGRSGESIRLAIEAEIPERVRTQGKPHTLRYEVVVGHDEDGNELGIQAEMLTFHEPGQRILSVPEIKAPSPTRLIAPAGSDVLPTPPHPHLIFGRGTEGLSGLYFEGGKVEHVRGFQSMATPQSSMLSHLRGNPVFPATAWLEALLRDGTTSIELDSHAMRRASPPGQTRGFRPDGSNLPWVVAALRDKHPEKFQDWIEHLRTALPDLMGVRVVDRPDDRHRYLMIQYQGDLEVPSWTTSEGTLRLMALTLLAYLPEREGLYLIEEPENGIHPRAIETVYRSLSNVYDAQVLLATHSPIILGLVEPEQLLCFAKNHEGATEIVLGSEHPRLRDWHKEVDLATLFAAGVLG